MSIVRYVNQERIKVSDTDYEIIHHDGGERKSNSQIGKYSHVNGHNNEASGDASTSDGVANTASGEASRTINISNTASGRASTSLGEGTVANGERALSAGYRTASSGTNTTTLGNRTYANHENQVVIGKFNANKTDTLFEVGNGSEENNRSNAMEVTSSGNIKAQNDVISRKDGGNVSLNALHDDVVHNVKPQVEVNKNRSEANEISISNVNQKVDNNFNVLSQRINDTNNSLNAVNVNTNARVDSVDNKVNAMGTSISTNTLNATQINSGTMSIDSITIMKDLPAGKATTIEISTGDVGYNGVAMPYIDFHNGGDSIDYTGRISAGYYSGLEFSCGYGKTGDTTVRVYAQKDDGQTLYFMPGKASSSARLGSDTYYWNAAHIKTVHNTSDRKLKDNIKEIEYAKDLILSLQPVEYTFNDGDSNGERKHMGFIAQDVHSIIKEKGLPNLSVCAASKIIDENPFDLAYYDENADDSKLRWSIAYTELIAPLVKVVQSQQKEIEELNNRIDSLSKK